MFDFLDMPPDAMQEEFDRLVAIRDAAYAAAMPHEVALDETNKDIARLQERALGLAASVEAAWNTAAATEGTDWIGLKRRIARLAKLLSGDKLLLAKLVSGA